MASLGYRSKAPARCAPVCAEAEERRREQHRRKAVTPALRGKKNRNGIRRLWSRAAVPPPFGARRHR